MSGVAPPTRSNMDISVRFSTVLLCVGLCSLVLVSKSVLFEEFPTTKWHPRPRRPLLIPFTKLEKDAIFFLDTDQDPVLSDMTLCALESAAKANQDKPIVLLKVFSNLKVNHQLNMLHLSQPQIEIRKVNLNTIIPMAGFKHINADSFLQSAWPAFHISDVLRIAILKLYGGTYLDSDAISIRALPKDKNFVVIETSESIANGLLKFQLGHPVIYEASQYLDQHFDPKGWADNGPVVITTAIKKLCKLPAKAKLTSINPKQCMRIKGYSSEKFLLIGTHDFWQFVESHSQDWIDDKLEELEHKSLSTHLWGHRYKMHHLEFDFKNFNASQLIYHIGRRYCPSTFGASRENQV